MSLTRGVSQRQTFAVFRRGSSASAKRSTFLENCSKLDREANLEPRQNPHPGQTYLVKERDRLEAKCTLYFAGFAMLDLNLHVTSRSQE